MTGTVSIDLLVVVVATCTRSGTTVLLGSSSIAALRNATTAVQPTTAVASSYVVILGRPALLVACCERFCSPDAERPLHREKPMDAGTIFTSLDTDGNGSLSMSELHCRLSDFGLGEDQIERVFFALDTNHDGVVDKQEFVNGFSKYQHIVSGGRADAFQCGPCKQWGFQKWKLDRWLDFDGHTISVYKCSGQPPAGSTPHFTLQMDTGICIPDPSNDCRFSIDTGTSIVHFKAESATICAAWVAAFKAASVSTHKERIDLIKQNKQFNEKVSGASGDYFLGEMLGSGGFASVKAGIHAETGQRVAAKIMPAASAAEKAHKQEIVNMAALKHPNVVEVLDVVYQAGKKRGQGSIYIMLELMSGGELFSRVVDNGCLCRRMSAQNSCSAGFRSTKIGIASD